MKEQTPPQSSNKLFCLYLLLPRFKLVRLTAVTQKQTRQWQGTAWFVRFWWPTQAELEEVGGVDLCMAKEWDGVKVPWGHDLTCLHVTLAEPTHCTQGWADFGRLGRNAVTLHAVKDWLCFWQKQWLARLSRSWTLFWACSWWFAKKTNKR